LLPAGLLCCDLRGGVAIPRFLSDADRPWIRTLVDECDRAAGRPVRELEARLREPLVGVPEDKRRLAVHLLLGFARSRVSCSVPPREARAALFTAAARTPHVSRREIVAGCATELGVTTEALLKSLFADLPCERVAVPLPSLDPADVALRANLALAQGLLARAHSVRIALEGNARAVARHASLRGLICAVTRDRSQDRVQIELSGPYALFRQTLLYGRALGAIVPVLAWTRRFELEARCDVRGRSASVTLASGDPIFPASEPKRFDSRVEERFARDFGRIAPGWVIVREPEPIDVEGHLFFPDFGLHPRSDVGRRWLVEIVGFWTPEYLARKLDRLRRARVSNLLLCIDDERNVGDGDLPEGAALIRYHRHVDAARVLEFVERQPMAKAPGHTAHQ
jgi:uncharacterized protein